MNTTRLTCGARLRISWTKRLRSEGSSRALPACHRASCAQHYLNLLPSAVNRDNRDTLRCQVCALKQPARLMIKTAACLLSDPRGPLQSGVKIPRRVDTLRSVNAQIIAPFSPYLLPSPIGILPPQGTPRCPRWTGTGSSDHPSTAGTLFAARMPPSLRPPRLR